MRFAETRQGSCLQRRFLLTPKGFDAGSGGLLKVCWRFLGTFGGKGEPGKSTETFEVFGRSGGNGKPNLEVSENHFRLSGTP